MLELASLFRERTRARLDPVELAYDLGSNTVPVDPIDTNAAPEQQTAAG